MSELINRAELVSLLKSLMSDPTATPQLKLSVIHNLIDVERIELTQALNQGNQRSENFLPKDYVQQLFLVMASNYMKPSTVAITQSIESMNNEAVADAKRLRLAVECVLKELKPLIAVDSQALTGL